jgi:4-carboxymuconolactone decarboxylase
MTMLKNWWSRLCVAGLVWVVVIAPAYAQMPTKRFPQITVEELDAQQRPVAEEILKVSSVGLAGPYNPLLRSPLLADRTVKLLDYLRFNTSVPRRLNEFAILIQARLWTSQLEWVAHHPLALKAGLAESVAEDLKVGRRPAGMKPDEELVYDLCMELSTQHKVSDATFARAKTLFTEQQIVDLVAVSGTYASVAMLLALAEEPAAGGQTPLQPIAR